MDRLFLLLLFFLLKIERMRDEPHGHERIAEKARGPDANSPWDHLRRACEGALRAAVPNQPVPRVPPTPIALCPLDHLVSLPAPRAQPEPEGVGGRGATERRGARRPHGVVTGWFVPLQPGRPHQRETGPSIARALTISPACLGPTISNPLSAHPRLRYAPTPTHQSEGRG